MSEQLNLLPDLPQSVLDAARARLDAAGYGRTGLSEWARRSYYVRRHWPTLQYRKQFPAAVDEMRRWRQELRDWLSRVHDDDPACRQWIELAMIDAVLSETETSDQRR